MAWDEDRLHRWLGRRGRPPVLVGSVGHDAAVLRALRGRVVSCVDQTIEGVHFEPADRPGRVGRKAAGRALSDLAATAARPRALLLALAAPRGQSEAHLRRLIAAVDARGRAHGAALVAGDLSQTRGPLSLTVTALGELGGRRRAPGRDRARAGQVVVLTGPVGGSSLGRHLDVKPRIGAGQALYAAGASALMDVSDGLAWDLFRLARASGVRVELDLARVPVHAHARRLARSSGRAALWHALHDGEDHELVATLSRSALAALVRGGRTEVFEIGRVASGRGLVLADGDRSSAWDQRGGWRHGG